MFVVRCSPEARSWPGLAMNELKWWRNGAWLGLPFIINDGVGAAESSYFKKGVVRAAVLQTRCWAVGEVSL